MTLIDRAVLKAYERLEPHSMTSQRRSNGRPAAKTAAFGSPGELLVDDTGRELFLHEPDSRLQGIHRTPHPRAGEPQTTTAREDHGRTNSSRNADDHAVQNGAELAGMPKPPSRDGVIEPLINSLLSYELSIQGPLSEDWQIVQGHEPHEPAEPSKWSYAEDSPHDDDTVTVADEADALSQPEAAPRESEESNPPISLFKPAWETDAFLIPDICQRIQHELQDHVQQAASRLMDDCIAERPLIRINGVGRSVGQTTVSILLSQALAKAGMRVLLMDGDISKADLSDQLGVAVDGGWNANLTSLSQLSEYCVQSISDNFCVLPFDPQPSDGFLPGQV